MLNRAGGKVVDVIERNDSPDTGQPFPAVYTENGKKDGG